VKVLRTSPKTSDSCSLINRLIGTEITLTFDLYPLVNTMHIMMHILYAQRGGASLVLEHKVRRGLADF
jgi:hypothetical protein